MERKCLMRNLKKCQENIYMRVINNLNIIFHNMLAYIHIKRRGTFGVILVLTLIQGGAIQAQTMRKGRSSIKEEAHNCRLYVWKAIGSWKTLGACTKKAVCFKDWLQSHKTYFLDGVNLKYTKTAELQKSPRLSWKPPIFQLSFLCWKILNSRC